MHKINISDKTTKCELLHNAKALFYAILLIPSSMNISIGAQKNFKKWFEPSVGWAIDTLKNYSRTLGFRALVIFIVWIIFIGLIGLIYFKGIIGDAVIFIFAAAFYVCDLICVLFW